MNWMVCYQIQITKNDKMSHYIPKNKKDENDILKTLEIDSFEELVSIIPSHLRVKDGILGLEKGISEYELTSYIDSISKNHNNHHSVCYSGGGVYDHFVPKKLLILFHQDQSLILLIHHISQR